MIRLATSLFGSFVILAVPVVAQELDSGTSEFDSYVFQAINNPENPTAALQAQVDLEIIRISRSADVLAAQTERLRLAGLGDIQRFYVRLEAARREVMAMNKRQDGNSNMYQLAQPFRNELQKGLFGAGSLFQKVALNSLTDQQSEALLRDLARLEKLQAESAIKMFVAKIGLHLPLSSVQRTQLTNVMLDNIKTVGSNRTFQFHIVLYRFGKIPREQYEAFLDKGQMKMLMTLTQFGDDLGDFLKQEGAIDDDES